MHRQALQLVDLLYEGAVTGEFHPFISALGDVVPLSRNALHFYENDGSGREVGIEEISATNFAPEAVASYVEHFQFCNPVHPVLHQDVMLPGRVAFQDEAISRDALRRTEYYNDWCQRQPDIPIEAAFGVMIVSEPNRVGALSVHFSREMGEDDDYVRNAREVMELVAPHLRRAFELRRRLGRAALQVSSLEATLDRLPQAVFLVHSDMRLSFANRRGEELLRQGDPLVAFNGHLAALSVTEAQMLAASVDAACRHPGAAAPASLALARRDQRKLGLFVSRLSFDRSTDSTARLDRYLSQPLAAIFVAEPDGGSAGPAQLLELLYGLTPAEIRLTCALAEDLTLAEYAERSGISHHTARTQLKMVFERTGCRRQSELVRLVTRLASAYTG